MLSLENRLKNKKDFDRVFKDSRPIFGGKMAIRCAKRQKPDLSSRFGFVVSNKVDKRATRRNALRRRLREITRSLICDLITGYDVVVLVKQNYNFPYETEEIKRDLVGLLRKAKLITTKP